MRNTISKALVTGGAGFIGSHIVDQLLAKCIETYVIDNFSTGSIDNLAQHDIAKNRMLHLIKGDIGDVEKLLRDIDGIDVVFHQAAIASVPKSVSDPILVHNVNVNASLNLMSYCLKSGVRRFIFASSAAVYGILEGNIASETIVCEPNSPYGASKLAIEDYLHAFMKTYGLETVILRYFNVYGPRQKNSDYSGVITIFINKILAGENPVIFGDGMQVRDFVHVNDVAHTNMFAMNSRNAAGEVFNVGSGKATSILKLLEIITELANKKAKIKSSGLSYRFEPPRPGDMKFGLASIDKIIRYFGYSSETSLEAGISELIDFISSKRAQSYLQIREGVA